MERKNCLIRKAAEDSGVFLYQVAERLGVGEYTFCRKLRKELPEAEQQRVLEVIRELAAGRED